jgi:hypothetical protein
LKIHLSVRQAAFNTFAMANTEVFSERLLML